MAGLLENSVLGTGVVCEPKKYPVISYIMTFVSPVHWFTPHPPTTPSHEFCGAKKLA
jgi:hypothetical protein